MDQYAGHMFRSRPTADPEILNLIHQLTNAEKRREALYKLSQRRWSIPDLAPMLWNSFGTVTSLLGEVISTYPLLNTPKLTARQSALVCDVLALFQIMANHRETRLPFVRASIHSYLFAFLCNPGTAKPDDYLRLSSLGVIASSLRSNEQEVVHTLIHTELIPACLQIMAGQSELNKIVATHIVQRIIMDETGLLYVCGTFERFSHVAERLGDMVVKISLEPHSQTPFTGNLLRHIIRCYLCLSENSRAREGLRQRIPEPLITGCLNYHFAEDDPARIWLHNLSRMMGVLPPMPVSGKDERSYAIQWNSN